MQSYKGTYSPRVIYITALILTVVMVAGALFGSLALRQQIYDAWQKKTSETTQLLAATDTLIFEQVADTIEDIQHHIVPLERLSDASLVKHVQSLEFHRRLKKAADKYPVLDVISVVGTDGVNLAFSRDYPAVPTNHFKQPYFQFHLFQNHSQIYIDEPRKSHLSGDEIIHVSSRINDPYGQFLGVILVGISANQLRQINLKAAKALGVGATVSLLKQDQTALVSATVQQSSGESIKQDHSLPSPERASMQTEVAMRAAPFDAMRAEKSVENWAMKVVLTVPKQAYLAEWYSSLMMVVTLCGGCLAAIATALGVLLRHFKEREKAFEVMEKLKNEAQASDIAKATFLSTMSHELRTPLNGVLGIAQLLMEKGITESDRREYARVVQSSGQSLLNLLNKMLDFSQGQAGGLTLRSESCRPADLLKDQISAHERAAMRKNLRVQAHWIGSPSSTYMLDRARIGQMLNELVENAIAFTDKGVVQVEGVEMAYQDGIAEIEFSVTDSGKGIKQSDKARLFKPFSQIDGSNTRTHQGSGMGLALVATLARQMGGRFGVESSEGEGARFWFSVKVHRSPDVLIG